MPPLFMRDILTKSQEWSIFKNEIFAGDDENTIKVQVARSFVIRADLFKRRYNNASMIVVRYQRIDKLAARSREFLQRIILKIHCLPPHLAMSSSAMPHSSAFSAVFCSKVSSKWEAFISALLSRARSWEIRPSPPPRTRSISSLAWPNFSSTWHLY